MSMSKWQWYWQKQGETEGAPVFIESPEKFIAMMNEAGINTDRSNLIGPISPSDTRKAQQVDDLKATLDALRAENENLLDIINDLADTSRCSYDHHGYCQEHGWFESGKECPHARAMKLFPPIISSHAQPTGKG